MTCNEYEDGIFGCTKDCSICVYGWFCAPCLNGQNWAKSRNEDCNIYHCCMAVHPFWVRKTVAKEKGEEKTDLQYCLITCCCGPCAMCQDARALGTGFEVPTQDQLH